MHTRNNMVKAIPTDALIYLLLRHFASPPRDSDGVPVRDGQVAVKIQGNLGFKR